MDSNKRFKRLCQLFALAVAMLLFWTQGISSAHAFQAATSTGTGVSAPAPNTSDLRVTSGQAATDEEVPDREAQEPTERGTIRGTITDADGKPLPHATVSISNEENQGNAYSTQTDEDGFYTVDIPTGTYRVHASYASGEQTAGQQKENAVVRTNRKTTINFSLGFAAGKKTGAVKGNVTGAAEAAAVTLLLRDEKNDYIWSTTPGADGAYLIGAIPSGTYVLRVEWTDATGKQLSKTEEVKISIGKTSVQHFSLTSDDADEAEPGKKVRSLLPSPNRSKISLRPGESQIIELTAKYVDKSEANVTEKARWSSSDERVATVENGLITAVGYGNAKITAEYGGKSLYVNVEIAIKSLSSNVKRVNIMPSESQEIKIIAEMSDRTKVEIPANDVNWKSDDTGVATVEAGVITVHSYGKATITAEYANKKVKIQVEAVLKGLEANPKKLSLKPGDEEKIVVYAVLGDRSKVDVTDQVKWKIKNDDVVELRDGKLIAVGFGKATLTGEYGGKKITISVDVSLKKLTASPKKVELEVGEEEILTLTATYGDGTTEDVEADRWTVQDSSIASVKDGVLTAKKAGRTQVIGTFGNKKATIQVTVKK